jgi:GR25 family glycosyltransferase involved in LPS biosynthesis
VNLNNLSPVVLFTYNRPEHTSRVLQALKKNKLAKHSLLYIYQDGLKTNPSPDEKKAWIKVNRLLYSVKGFKDVKLRVSNKNQGCGKSITKGITEVLEENQTIIVLEDDILVSPTFLNYMNQALIKFSSVDSVGSINAYSYNFKKKLPEFFFLKGVNPYGWATWKEYWKMFNNDSKILLKELKDKKLIRDWDYGGTLEMLEATVSSSFEGAWDVKWYTSLYLKDKLGLFPSHSFSRNIGFDSTATHTLQVENLNKYQYSYERLNDKDELQFLESIRISENKKVKKYIQKFYKNILGHNKGIKDSYYLLKHYIKTKVLKIVN